MSQIPNRAPEQWGMMSIYTGDGKGKTTAALGSAIRAAAKGKRVAIVYFDKGGTTHYSERDFLHALGANLKTDNQMVLPEIFPTGLDRIDPVSGRFRFGVLPEDIAEAARGLQIVADLFDENKAGASPDSAQSKYDLIVMDEINSTTALGMLNEQDVLALINKKPAKTELILTGRNAPQSFLDKADLVTEMKLVKHYFYKGVSAREGIDY